MRRLPPWPWPFLLLLVGAAIATSRLAPSISLSPDLILFVFLPPLLFEAAFSLRAAALGRELNWILLLGVVGALVSAGLTLAMLRALRFPADQALLLAVCLAATDPVSVFAALRTSPAPERVRLVLEGESLANDGVAVVLFALAASHLHGAAPTALGLLTRFVWLSAGGLIVGTVLGFVVTPLLVRSRVFVGTMVTILVAYLGYVLAERLGVSGLLSVIAVALRLGNLEALPGHHRIGRFWRGAGLLVSGIVFLLMGLQVEIGRILGIAIPLLVLLAVVLLARLSMIAALTSWPHGSWPARCQAAMVWAGLRGALSLALALSVPPDVPDRMSILLLAFGYVFVSLTLQGLTIGPVFRWLKLTATAKCSVPGIP